jgi:hypothetical protein
VGTYVRLHYIHTRSGTLIWSSGKGCTLNVHGPQTVLPDGMHIFKPKTPNLGKFWRALQCKMLVYFMAIWSIRRSFGLVCGNFVYFMVFSYIFPVLVCCTKKNLATLATKCKIKHIQKSVHFFGGGRLKIIADHLGR